MFPRDYTDYKIISDTPAEGDDFRTIDLSQPDVAKVCPHCDCADFIKKGRETREVRDITHRGEKVILNINVQRYQCRRCGKKFYGPLPHSVPQNKNVSTDLLDYMVDYFIESQELEEVTTIASVAEKFGESPATIAFGLKRRIDIEQRKIESLHPCISLIAYPFSYGNNLCYALWGYDDDNIPLLYDIRSSYDGTDVKTFLEAHPFEEYDPMAAFADLTKDVLMALHVPFKNLPKGMVAEIGVLKELFYNNINEFRDCNKIKFNSEIDKVLSALECHVFRDNNSTGIDNWVKKHKTSHLSDAFTTFLERVEAASNECRIGMQYDLHEYTPTEQMDFIMHFRENNVPFEEMRYTVLNSPAMKNDESIPLALLMLSYYEEKVHGFCVNLNELNGLYPRE